MNINVYLYHWSNLTMVLWREDGEVKDSVDIQLLSIIHYKRQLSFFPRNKWSDLPWLIVMVPRL